MHDTVKSSGTSRKARLDGEIGRLYFKGICLPVPSEEAVFRILEYQAEGLSVQGTSDPSVSTILAVAGGEGVC